MARVEPRPGGAKPRPGTDAALRWLARAVLGVLFREVGFLDAGRLPASGPVIVIANHTNSLIDGAVLLGFLPRIPRFLSASTVWDYKPVAPFMNASGSVKVFRQQDGRAQEGSLERSFADAAALLADGGVLAIFPEGRTHDDPPLLPFKTGTARIVRFTKARFAGLDLPIMPVGIDYEVKNLLRTRVCFTFGEPVRLDAHAGEGEATGADGASRAPPRGGAAGGADRPVRAATARLQRALSAVAPDFSDRDEARAMALAGEILAAEPDVKPGHPPPFSRIVARRHTVEAAFLGAPTVAQAHETRAALDEYAQALAKAGLADHEVAAPPEAATLLRWALTFIAGLPVALLGLMFCLPQALLLRKVSRTKPRDRQMTWVTFGGVVVYPLTWLAWAVALGLAFGAAFGAGWGLMLAGAVVVLAPLSGRLALPVLDLGRQIARAVRARRRLRRDPGLRPRLAASRARAQAALDALLVGRPG